MTDGPLAFLAGPGVLYLVLAALVIEGAIVSLARRRRSGVRARGLLYNVAAGAGLVLAMLFQTAGAEPLLVAASLLLALVAHVLDLRERLAPHIRARRAGEATD